MGPGHRESQQNPGLHQEVPGDRGKLLPSFTQHLLDNVCAELRTPNTGRTLTNSSDFSSSCQGGLSLEWLLHAEMLGEEVLFRLGQRWLWGYL